MPSVRLLPPCVVDLQCAYAFQACCKSTSEGHVRARVSSHRSWPRGPSSPFSCPSCVKKQAGLDPNFDFVFLQVETDVSFWHTYLLPVLAATRQTLRRVERREMARWQVQSDPPLCERVWRERASAQAEERPVVEPGCTLHCTFAFAIPPPLLARAQKLRCVLTMRNEETGAPCRATRS